MKLNEREREVLITAIDAAAFELRNHAVGAEMEMLSTKIAKAESVILGDLEVTVKDMSDPSLLTMGEPTTETEAPHG